MVETHKTFCRFCHALCGIEVDVADNRVVAVRGDRDNVISRGYTCAKGRALPDQHHHPDRLRGTVKRAADGSFQPIPSETAMDEVAERLLAIQQRHGPSSLAVYSGTHGLFSTAAPLIISWVRALGTPYYFTPNTIDQPSQSTARARCGSWDAGGSRFCDADVMLFIGNNPGVSAFSRDGGPPYANGFGYLKEAGRRGMKIIAIDPRRTELARRADLHLQVRPGEDPTLLAGMLRTILEEGLYDREFTDAHVEGLAALREAVADYTPDYVERRSLVPASQVVEAARLFARGRSGSAMSCTGVNMAPRPDVTQHFVSALNALCGRFNREGDLVANPGALQPPRSHYAEVVPPKDLWGKGPQSRFRGLGHFMGEMPINVFADEILTEGEGQIRALVCIGGNPAVAFPDQRKVFEALRALELSVVLDVRMTATAQLAHYVFGCKLSLEKPSTSRTAELQFDVPFAQYTPAILEPEFDVIQEWEFLWGMAHRMRTPIKVARGVPLDLDRKPGDEEFLELLHTGSRVALSEVRKYPSGHVFEPDEPARVQPARPEHTEARMNVAPAAVIRQLREIRGEAVSDSGGYTGEGEFSHRLISRRMLDVYNSTGDHLPGLRRRFPYNPAFMNAACMAAIGVDSGDVVRIDSDHDFIYGVAERANDIRPGVISMSHARGGEPDLDGEVRNIGSTTNRLVSTERNFEPISGIPRQSAIPVNVRRLSAEELAAVAPARP